MGVPGWLMCGWSFLLMSQILISECHMLREKGNSSFLRPQTRDKCCKCLDKDLAVPGQRLPWQHLTLKIWFSFSSHEENVTTYVKELWEEFLLTVLFCCRIKALLLEDALWGHHAAGYYWDNECSSQWPRGLWKSVSSLCVSVENWVGTSQSTSITTACALMLSVPKNVFKLTLCGPYKRASCSHAEAQ